MPTHSAPTDRFSVSGTGALRDRSSGSLLLNVVLIILLTGLVEIICVPLLQLAAVKDIDSNSKFGRLLVSFLAAFLFIGGLRGAVVLFVSLIAR